MKHYAKIDNNGHFVEDVVVEKIYIKPIYNKDGTIKKDGYYDYPDIDTTNLVDVLPDKDTMYLRPTWDRQNRKWIDAPTAEEKEEAKKWINAYKKTAIGEYIYAHYSEQKQSQDRGYQAYAQTVVVGMTAQTDNPVTLDALTVEIMGVVMQIFAEEVTLADYVATKPTDLQEHYEKLIKIGMRLKWTKACIDEGKLAIAENRDPDYPPYPNFEGGAA